MCQNDVSCEMSVSIGNYDNSAVDWARFLEYREQNRDRRSDCDSLVFAQRIIKEEKIECSRWDV